MTAISSLPRALREIYRLRAELAKATPPIAEDHPPIVDDRPRYFRGVLVGPKIDTEYEAAWVADLDKKWRKIARQTGDTGFMEWQYLGGIGEKAERRKLWAGVESGQFSMTTGRDGAGHYVAYARLRPAWE